METEAERDQRVEVGKECYLCGDPSHRTGDCDQRRRPEWTYFACSMCGGVHEEPVEGFRMRECPSAWASYKLPTVHEKLVRSGEKCQYAFGGKDGTCNGVGHTRFDHQNWGRERRKYYMEKLREGKLEKITQMELRELEEEYDDFLWRRDVH